MSAWLLRAIELILLAAPATGAAVVGTIWDGETGAPLAGAVVALTDIDRTAVSDSSGRYVLRDIAPGPQHVVVRRIGYAARTLHALVPPRGQLELNIALRPQPVVLRAVEVRPPVAVRGVEGGDSTSFPDRGATIADVRNHPLLEEPDVLLALGGGEVVMSPESPSGVHIRGGASDQTAYVLDGIPVFNPYHAAGTFGAWNPDAVERLDVVSSPPATPGALSGTVAAVTRAPGPRVRSRGSVSTTQRRATVDGPFGDTGAGYLLSVRSGTPDLLSPRREPSYLRAELGDVLAKVEAPALSGRARLLLFESENELDAAARAGAAAPARNALAWRSRSIGAEWSRLVGRVDVRLRSWSASGDADAVWNARGDSLVSMTARRRDEGLAGVVERSAPGTRTIVAAGLRHDRTSYRAASRGAGMPSLLLRARRPIAAVFAGHRRALGTRVTANVALSATAADGRAYLDPQGQLRVRLSPRLGLSGSYARTHQFSQSLRNPESVVGTVFPADLSVGAGAAGIPVARGDGAVLAAEYRPRPGVRLGAQAYRRDANGLVLVAPRTAEPFAVRGWSPGSSASRGVSLELAVSGARYGLLASYGWERTRLVYGDSSYVPEHAARHLIDAGVIVFPTPTSSIRLGATGASGRRATAVSDAFEWRACNLVDRGCELVGSPRAEEGRLGAAKLPPYLRLDLGVRKHWHLAVAGRDATVALFGSVTNLLGRKNVLTVATDSATGAPIRIAMRPLAPLAVGLDWQF